MSVITGLTHICCYETRKSSKQPFLLNKSPFKNGELVNDVRGKSKVMSEKRFQRGDIYLHVRSPAPVHVRMGSCTRLIQSQFSIYVLETQTEICSTTLQGKHKYSVYNNASACKQNSTQQNESAKVIR